MNKTSGARDIDLTGKCLACPLCYGHCVKGVLIYRGKTMCSICGGTEAPVLLPSPEVKLEELQLEESTRPTLQNPQ